MRRAAIGYEGAAMSTEPKSSQGRHRAAVSARPPFAPTGVALMVGGIVVVLAGLVAIWEVV
jgi:hypothetical protein